MFPLEQGAFEMLLIGAIALIVVGPKDLPMLMRKVGQFTAKMRGLAAEFRASFDEMARQSELDDLRREVEALRTGVTSGLSHDGLSQSSEINPNPYAGKGHGPPELGSPPAQNPVEEPPGEKAPEAHDASDAPQSSSIPSFDPVSARDGAESDASVPSPGAALSLDDSAPSGARPPRTRRKSTTAGGRSDKRRAAASPSGEEREG